MRETYKSVSKIKSRIDTNKPKTFDMMNTNNTSFNNKRNNRPVSAKEKFEDMEHIRRLEAMSKRILSIGKVNKIKF